MNIKLCLQSVLFSFLLISVGAYADTTTGGTTSKGGDTKMQTTTTTDEGFSNKGNKGDDQGNVKSMQTTSYSGDKGYHHKHKGWHHGEGGYYSGVGYEEPYHEGTYCKKIHGHYNRFGDWIPKHKVCFESY